MWHVHTEIQTAFLVHGDTLSNLATQLAVAEGVSDVSTAAGSIGSRYSVLASLRLPAADATSARHDAVRLLAGALAAAHIESGKVLANGLLDG